MRRGCKFLSGDALQIGVSVAKRLCGSASCYGRSAMKDPDDTLPTVLIVDDHPIVLYGLRFALEQQTRFAVCGEAGHAESARVMARDLRPDYIILDLVLGGRDGLELVRDLAGMLPASRILIYSSQRETPYARRSIDAGARGYVSKSEGLEVVVKALDVIAGGEIFIGEGLRRQLLDDFVATGNADGGQAGTVLSERELQVLRLIGDGRTLSQIAIELGISTKTVGTYRDRLKTKLGIDNVHDLSFWARSDAYRQ